MFNFFFGRIYSPIGVVHALATLLQLKDLWKTLILKNSSLIERRNERVNEKETNGCLSSRLAEFNNIHSFLHSFQDERRKKSPTPAIDNGKRFNVKLSPAVMFAITVYFQALTLCQRLHACTHTHKLMNISTMCKNSAPPQHTTPLNVSAFSFNVVLIYCRLSHLLTI